jgi:GNAT superfamily N-acetyltransferase
MKVFQHFSQASYLVERADGRLVALLIEFLSPSQPDVAYIHFVGVDPELRRTGLGDALYRRFFDVTADNGARNVKYITSPANTTSLAFHAALGFDLAPTDIVVNGVAVQRDYNGPGLDRVVFSRQLRGGSSTSRES